MTPVPIDLPLRPGEAATLAALIYEQAGERRLTDDVRARLGGRAAVLGLKTVKPYFGSLESDPTHPGTFYLAVDGLRGEQRVALVLHMTPANSPASGIFPKPLLIGRMRPTQGREIVMNAIAFSAEDSEAVEAYAVELSRQFLPRAHGALPLVWVDSSGDPHAAVDALLAFRSFHRTTGLNIAGLWADGGPVAVWRMVWAAIRAGYRDGYSLAGPFRKDTARLLSCFRLRSDEALEAVRTLRSVRGGVPFDIELDAREGLCEDTLEALKAAGALPHFVLTAAGEAPHGALPSLSLAAESIGQVQHARQTVHGPCAVTLRWNGREPAAALLLDALR